MKSKDRKSKLAWWNRNHEGSQILIPAIPTKCLPEKLDCLLLIWGWFDNASISTGQIHVSSIGLALSPTVLIFEFQQPAMIDSIPQHKSTSRNLIFCTVFLSSLSNGPNSITCSGDFNRKKERLFNPSPVNSIISMEFLVIPRHNDFKPKISKPKSCRTLPCR